MADNRSARLITKRTTVPGKIPSGTTGNETNLIQSGELASNLSDKKLWGYNGTNVFEYGSNSFLGLTGGTITGNTRVIGSFSADTLYSGSTDVETIIRNLISTDTYTFVQPGSNIITGGTTQLPVISTVDSPFFNNITISGDTSLQGTTATTISATTIAVGDYVDFYSGTTGSTDPTPLAGRVYYDNSENALSYYPNTPNMDVTINLGQEGVVLAHNGTGSIITNGSACHINGVNGDGHPTVQLAIASGVTVVTDTKFQVTGIATHDIAPGDDGFITTYGIVRDLNITGVTPGSDIFLSDTIAGEFNYDLNSISGSSRVSRLGHVISTGTTTASILVEIENEAALTLLSAKQAEILTQNNASTGVIQGGVLTTATTTTFNVTSGKGYIANNIDQFNPILSEVNWDAFTGVTSTYVSDTGETFSYIYVDINGGLVQIPGSTLVTSQQKRGQILLGGLLHVSGQLLQAWERPVPLTNPINQLEDLSSSIGSFSVTGNRISKITGTLSLQKSLGTSFYLGGNYDINSQNPNIITEPILSADTFMYAAGTGLIGLNGTTIDIDNYDPNGFGIVTALTSNNYTAHRIWHQPSENLLIFQYGQNEYTSLASAKADFSTFDYIAPDFLLKEAYILAVIISRSGEPDLDNPLRSIIVPQAKFAGTGGGGTTPDTLQTAYGNSTSPEITTDSLRGPVDFRTGVLEESQVVTFQSTGGTVNAFVQGDGNSSFKSLSATTFYSGSTNLYDIFVDSVSGGTNVNVSGTDGNPTISVVDSPSFNNVLFSGTATGGDIIANSVSATTISGSTIYSGGTDLSNIFQTIHDIDHTQVQPGVNTYTGGTIKFPTINVVDSPSFNNIEFSGTATGGDIIANSVSATTIYINGTSVDNISHTGLTEIGLRTHPELDDVWSTIVGSIVENPKINIVESGGTVSLELEQDGGGDLTLNLTGGSYVFDSTPAVSIALTSGTDTVPVLNYIYIDGITKLLTASLAPFPETQYIPIATVLLQSASSVASDGPYKVHQWSDHLLKGGDNGHLSHINYWIRLQQATYESGVDQTLTITPSASTLDDVIFNSTSGTILQLHEHAFPTFSGTPDMYVVNDSVTPYNKITNLNEILTDSLGNSLVNRRFSVVIWGAVNEESGDCKLFVNLPSGAYGTDNGVIRDVNGYANFSIPNEFVGVGFMISEYDLRHRSESGGTWSLIKETDLRGVFPIKGAITGSTVNGEFRDNYAVIAAIEDFPEAVNDVITLEDNYIYEIVGNINLGNSRIELGDKSKLEGKLRTNDGIIYTGTSAAIISNGADFSLNTIFVSAPLGTVFEFSATTGSEQTNFIAIENCIFNNINSLGVVENVRLFGFENNIIENAANGLAFNGSQNGTFLMYDNIIPSMSGTSVQFNSSGWDNVTIDRNIITVMSGQTGISGLTANGNLKTTGRGRVTSNGFIGGGAYIEGINTGGTRWQFLGNDGIPDDTDANSNIEVYITDNTSATTITTIDTPTQVTSLNWNVDFFSRFTYTGGTVTYAGADDTRISMDATVYFTSTNNQDLNYYFSIDSGAGFQVLTSTKAPSRTQGADSTTFANPKGLLDVSFGDKIALFVENTTSSSDIKVTDMNWTINT